MLAMRSCLRRARRATQRRHISRPRFYEHTGVEAVDQGWSVTLELGKGRSKKLPTPAGAPLLLPTKRLALAIAAEWDGQTEKIEPAAMPLMALASTAVDQLPKERDQTLKNILAYAATDTCRFVADDQWQPEVCKRQDKLHEPLLAWLKRAYGADLERGAPGALRAPPTSPETATALREACGALSNWHLAALQSATFECKSLTIGLALLANEVDAEAAEQAARVEENQNIERWGLVEGAHDYDLARVRVQLCAASFFADGTA